MWQGILTSDNIPSEINPPRGYVVNISNRIDSQGVKYDLDHNLAINY